jgi:hypothetical protein
MTVYNYDITKNYHSINPYDFIEKKTNVEINETHSYLYDLICLNDYVPKIEHFDFILTSYTIDYTEKMLKELKTINIINIEDVLPFIDERKEEEVHNYHYCKINNKFKCLLCNKELSSKQSLYNHIINKNIHNINKENIKEKF